MSTLYSILPTLGLLLAAVCLAALFGKAVRCAVQEAPAPPQSWEECRDRAFHRHDTCFGPSDSCGYRLDHDLDRCLRAFPRSPAAEAAR